MTAFEALRLTRGQWRHNQKGEVVCPVCGVAIFWADYARARHLTLHLRQGWSPMAAPPDSTPAEGGALTSPPGVEQASSAP